MVLVGSLSLVQGLSTGSSYLLDRLQKGPTLYAQGGEILDSRIDPQALAAVPFDFDALRIHVGRLEVNGLNFDVVFASLESHREGNVTTPYPVGPDDVSADEGLRDRIAEASGEPIGSSANVTILGGRLADVPIVDPPPSKPAFLPDDWAYVRPEFFLAVSSQEGAFIQGIVTRSPLDPEVASALGLEKVDLVGAAGFLRGSTNEAAQALTVLAFVLTGVLSLLVYAGMSLEVDQRTREIRILRSLGASPALVAAVYEGQALSLAVLGATLGSALGIVLAHAVVAFAPLVGLANLVILSPPWEAVVLTFWMALLASALGGLVPSGRAALLVRRPMEVTPS